MEQDRGLEGSAGGQTIAMERKTLLLCNDEIKSHLQDTSLEAKSTDPGTVRNMVKDKTR